MGVRVTDDGKKSWDWKQPLAAAAVLVVTAASLWGLNSSVKELDQRVDRLTQAVVKVQAIDREVERLQRDVQQIERVRADILQAICAANATSTRALRKCLDGG